MGEFEFEMSGPNPVWNLIVLLLHTCSFDCVFKREREIENRFKEEMRVFDVCVL